MRSLYVVFGVLLVGGVAACSSSSPGGSVSSASSASSSPPSVGLDSSDATYALTYWNSHTADDTWEVSNGFLKTGLHSELMRDYKLPFANCMGFEASKTMDLQPNETALFLICQATKSTVADECGERMEMAKLEVKKGELFAYRSGNQFYCGGQMFHLEKKQS